MKRTYEFYAAGRGRHSTCLAASACMIDSEAFELALRLASHDLGIEAWQGDRLVCSVPPKRQLTASMG